MDGFRLGGLVRGGVVLRSLGISLRWGFRGWDLIWVCWEVIIWVIRLGGGFKGLIYQRLLV